MDNKYFFIAIGAVIGYMVAKRGAKPATAPSAYNEVEKPGDYWTFLGSWKGT